MPTGISARTTASALPQISLERRAFGVLVALLLAPVLAQGLWRPLAHLFGSPGQAAAVTGATLAVAAVIAVIRQFRWPRAPLLALAVGAATAIASALGLGLGIAGLLTLLVVAAATAALLAYLARQVPDSLDGLAQRHKAATVLYVVVALASVLATARLSIFMGDPTRGDQQVVPEVDFLRTHSCLTAYVEAAALVRRRVDNVYDVKWWRGSEGQPPLAQPEDNPYRPFLLDYYAYPPPFLLVMMPLAPFAGDYPAQRALWFGLNGLLLALGLWVVARWMGGANAHRPLLMAPLFFGSLPVLATLQVGNFQISVVVLSVLAMVALQRKQAALGGAVLAFAVLSKVSPGLLGLVLLAQRRWRSVAWTAACGLVLLGLSVAVLGVNPLQSFVTYALPRISSGEAFAFMDDRDFSIVTNLSPFGLPFKLQLLGVAIADPWAMGRHISRVFTLALLPLAYLAARRPANRRQQAVTWLSLLVLAALQSPFAPGYVSIGLLWAMTLLAAEVRGLAGAVALVGLAVLLTVVPPGGIAAVTAFSVGQMAVTAAVPVYLLLRRRELAD